tara:strand:+ start:236 stop:409 length:174 start_codon:yes stop_codon:yes gene_type:complete
MTESIPDTHLLIGATVIDYKIVRGRTYLILEKIINNESFFHEIEMRHRPTFDVIEYV